MNKIKIIALVSRLVRAGHGTGNTARAFGFAGLALAAAVIMLVRPVVATPSSNIVSATIMARASFLDPVDIKFKIDSGSQDVVVVREAQETVIQQIVIGPGGSTGWHSHPGPAVAMIRSGALAVYSGEDATCTPRIFLAGEAFVDHGQGHVHMARNPSATENVEVWVTYFDVPPGGSVRLDANDPGNCSF